MNEADFCLGFFAGMVSAGILGIFFQQMRLAYKQMGEAGRPQKIIAETKQTPAEVVKKSISAGFWFFTMIVVLLLILWLVIQAIS